MPRRTRCSARRRRANSTTPLPALRERGGRSSCRWCKRRCVVSGSANGYGRPHPARKTNPFPHGWRYVERVGPNGRIVVDQVPLTPGDVLHPRYGDVMPTNSAHNRDAAYLKDVFEARLAGDPTALVLCDVLVVWDDPVLRQHSPDLSVY